MSRHHQHINLLSIILIVPQDDQEVQMVSLCHLAFPALQEVVEHLVSNDLWAWQCILVPLLCAQVQKTSQHRRTELNFVVFPEVHKCPTSFAWG